MPKHKFFVALLAALAVTSCGQPSWNRDNAVTVYTVDEPAPNAAASETKEPDDTFVNACASLGFTLLNAENGTESRMVSPVSVLYALGMTANGAAGETKKQMEQALYNGEPAEDFNGYFRAFADSLPNSETCKLAVADSVWLNANFTPAEAFLQTCALSFDADIFGMDFAREDAVGRINGWTSEKTDKMIPQILDYLSPTSPAVLVNAVLFDAKWQKEYEDFAVYDEEFTDYAGNTTAREFLHSEEDSYFKLGKGTGFLRPYTERYSFVGILPDEGTDVFDYAKSINAEKFTEQVKNPQRKHGKVHVSMPSFTFDYDTELSETLAALGMPLAFSDAADFSAMGECDEPFCIGEVLHKTRIELTRHGTKAAAATAIVMETTAAMDYEEPIVITLDRPFVFAIVENGTGLPVFVGVYCGE